ncbi:hypothetical protein ACOJQI_10745 [Bacillus salacetis]|uniref:hypothetical protein n=1 Tax=Bacillus salacetis TaxID=2315464 RepID=UPI003BA0D50B
MIDTLKHVKNELEQALENPRNHALDHCVNELMEAKQGIGENQKMMDDVLNAVTHAMHAQPRLQEDGMDISSINAFKEAHNAVDQAIDTLSN